MPNQKLYLHEIIHIVGTGSDAYKRQTAQLGLGRKDGGSPLVGRSSSRARPATGRR
jgi:hypothetical protein